VRILPPSFIIGSKFLARLVKEKHDISKQLIKLSFVVSTYLPFNSDLSANATA
jgi:hypothetical protein